MLLFRAIYFFLYRSPSPPCVEKLASILMCYFDWFDQLEQIISMKFLLSVSYWDWLYLQKSIQSILKNNYASFSAVCSSKFPPTHWWCLNCLLYLPSYHDQYSNTNIWQQIEELLLPQPLQTIEACKLPIALHKIIVFL